jgi:hypothetical protein
MNTIDQTMRHEFRVECHKSKQSLNTVKRECLNLSAKLRNIHRYTSFSYDVIQDDIVQVGSDIRQIEDYIATLEGQQNFYLLEKIKIDILYSGRLRDVLMHSLTQSMATGEVDYYSSMLENYLYCAFLFNAYT